MDLFQLETFVAVVEEKSFSAAANKLHRTQPAVSQTIRKLESELGQCLFDRSRHGGGLTDVGRVLQDYAQRLLSLRNEAHRAMGAVQQLQTGALGIAANEFTSLYLLRVLNEFRRRCSTNTVVIQRSLASHIPQAVLEHPVDIGVVSFHPEEPALRSIVVYQDELMFVAPPSHPLASRSELSLKDLGAESFVAHNVPSPTRERVVQAFKRHKTPLHITVEMPTLEAIKKFVMMGNGITLVPGSCVEEETAKGELVRIPVSELRFERKLRIVYRKNANLSHATRAFLNVVEAIASTRKGHYLYQVEH
jgi:DNA-binding transcriptional LysR family regulator